MPTDRQISPGRLGLYGFLVAGLLAILPIAIGAQQSKATDASKLAADAQYADTQAVRGEAVYAQYCRSCHGPQLTGTEFGPVITGADFTARWRSRPTRDLFDLIRTTMPVNSAGGLSTGQYADLTALILKRAGFPAGNAEFAPRADAIVRAPLAVRTDARSTPAPGWYTDAQAARGKVLFVRHCAMCHEGDPSLAKTSAQPDWGWALAENLLMRGIAVRGYPTVSHLFRRIRDGMPGWDIDAATPAQKVDIVAFLLKANGLPAGTTELPLDLSVMKQMPLAPAPPARTLEDGFEWLFDGTRITGLKYLFGFNCTPAPAGCGRTDPAGVVRIENGSLVTEGRFHGMFYTEKKYLDFDLRLEYRWVPPPDVDQDDEFTNLASAGYLLFVEEPKIWPRSIEIEGNEYGILKPAMLGGKGKSTYDEKTLARYQKAIGKWNDVRIVSHDGQVDAYLNGGLITHISEHSFKAGPIGFQYQGGRIEYRWVRIKG